MKHDFLRQELERKLQQEVRTPKDFRLLSERIAQETNTIISVDTLMRIWGYKGQVNTRRSTLDILAQFLGYTNYNAFGAAFPEDDIEDDSNVSPEAYINVGKGSDGPVPPLQECGRTVRNRKWLTTAVCLVVIVGIALGCMYFQSNEPAGNSTVEKQVHGKFLASMDEIRNDRQYYIHTRNDKRGLLGVNDNMPATTFKAAVNFRCDSASTFALLKYDDYYYIYSVQDKRFINVVLMETDKPLLKYYAEKDWCACDLHMRDSSFVFDFWSDHASNKVFTLNVNSGNGLIITDYGTMTEMWDDGNLFSIEDAGPFDPTEAFAMFGNID